MKSPLLLLRSNTMRIAPVKAGAVMLIVGL
jgi:hypothetical protein